MKHKFKKSDFDFFYQLSPDRPCTTCSKCGIKPYIKGDYIGFQDAVEKHFKIDPYKRGSCKDLAIKVIETIAENSRKNIELIKSL